MPALKIHTWGGLGSQLFAVALAFDIRDKFPRRKIKIVLHTDGVTLRLPEVTDLFPGWDYEYISDFEGTSLDSVEKDTKSLQNFIHQFKVWVKGIAIYCRIIVNCNDDLESSYLQHWTMACRGHYSHRFVNRTFYEFLEQGLTNYTSSQSQEFGECFTIHYRLGDLLTLEQKSPISANLIISESDKLLTAREFDSLVVLSDSPEIAKNIFSKTTRKKLFTPGFNTFEVMSCATSSSYFLGTSSKVSFWIAAIRSSKLMIGSSLPKSNQAQMKYMLGSESDLIHYYG
jgi:hypothetical protein